MKPKPKIPSAGQPSKRRPVLPPAVGDGRNQADPAVAAARLPRQPTHLAAGGNHALHHAPRNAQS